MTGQNGAFKTQALIVFWPIFGNGRLLQKSRSVKLIHNVGFHAGDTALHVKTQYQPPTQLQRKTNRSIKLHCIIYNATDHGLAAVEWGRGMKGGGGGVYATYCVSCVK